MPDIPLTIIPVLKTPDEIDVVFNRLVAECSPDMTYDAFMAIAREIFITERDADTPAPTKSTTDYYLLKTLLRDFPEKLFAAGAGAAAADVAIPEAQQLNYLRTVLGFVDDLFKAIEPEQYQSLLLKLSDCFNIVIRQHNPEQGDKSFLPILLDIRRKLTEVIRHDSISLATQFSVREAAITRKNFGEHAKARDVVRTFFGEGPLLVGGPNYNYRLVESLDKIADRKLAAIKAEHGGSLPEEYSHWERYLTDRRKVTLVPASTLPDQSVSRPRETLAAEPLALLPQCVIDLSPLVNDFGARIFTHASAPANAEQSFSTLSTAGQRRAFLFGGPKLLECFDADTHEPNDSLKIDIISLLKGLVVRLLSAKPELSPERVPLYLNKIVDEYQLSQKASLRLDCPSIAQINEWIFGLDTPGDDNTARP